MGEIYKYKDLVDAYADAAPVGEGVEGGFMTPERRQMLHLMQAVKSGQTEMTPSPQLDDSLLSMIDKAEPKGQRWKNFDYLIQMMFEGTGDPHGSPGPGLKFRNLLEQSTKEKEAKLAAVEAKLMELDAQRAALLEAFPVK